jgi:Mn2+/Fe2+ NRAMP family transporter
MKKIIVNDLTVASIVLFSVFVLGLFLPMLVVSFLALFTNYKLIDMVLSGPFWFLTGIGWIMAAFYMNDSVKKHPNG